MDQTLAEDICLDWDTEAENETDNEDLLETKSNQTQNISHALSSSQISDQSSTVPIKKESRVEEENLTAHYNVPESFNSEDVQNDSYAAQSDQFKRRRCDKFVPKDKTSIENNDNLNCLFCFLHFNEKQDLLDHVEVCPKKDLTSRCVVCNISFSDRDGFFDHMMKHEADTYTRCDVCLINFTSKTKLAHHVLNVHFGGVSFICEFCDKTFSKKSALLTHKAEKHGSADYKCDACGAQFRGKNLLIQHIKKTHLKHLHSCRLCSASFKTKHKLLRHLRFHSKKKRQKNFLSAPSDTQFKLEPALDSNNLLGNSRNQEIKSEKSNENTKQEFVDDSENFVAEENSETDQYSSLPTTTFKLVFNGSCQEIVSQSEEFVITTPLVIKSDKGASPPPEYILTDSTNESELVLSEFNETVQGDSLESRNFTPSNESTSPENSLQDIDKSNSLISDIIVPDHTIVSDHLYAVAQSSLISQSSDVYTFNNLLGDPSDYTFIEIVLPEGSETSQIIENLEVVLPDSLNTSRVTENLPCNPDVSSVRAPQSECSSEVLSNSPSSVPISIAENSIPDSSNFTATNIQSGNLIAERPSNFESEDRINIASSSDNSQNDLVTAPNNAILQDNRNFQVTASTESQTRIINSKKTLFASRISSSRMSSSDQAAIKVNLVEKCIKALSSESDIFTQLGRSHKRPRILSEHIKRALSYRALKDQGEPQSIFPENFSCKVCGAVFAFKYDLFKHMRLHTANYKCDWCNTAFSKEEELAGHVLTSHFRRSARTGVNLLATLFTEKLNQALQMPMFPQKRSDETFTCDNCNATFGYESELAYHMLIHGDDFKCYKCKASFREKCDLAKHFLTAHL